MWFMKHLIRMRLKRKLNNCTTLRFAVKNSSSASRATVLDTASIKNHIAKGSYTKDDLKDGTKLTSISNETLYVTRTGNDVLINGVNIIGDAIQAGNSYVYIVPEIIPVGETPVTTYKHQTTIKVNLIDGEYNRWTACLSLPRTETPEWNLVHSPPMPQVQP